MILPFFFFFFFIKKIPICPCLTEFVLRITDVKVLY